MSGSHLMEARGKIVLSGSHVMEAIQVISEKTQRFKMSVDMEDEEAFKDFRNGRC